MARTTRTSRDYRRNAARDGQGYCCPGGKGCNVCRDNKRRSIIKGEAVTQADLKEWLAQ